MKEKIIIIDDEKIVRDVCERTLEKEGYEVLTFSNGFTALDEARKTHIDLVITDIMMPDMGGVEVLKKIKVISADTEVIVMTGYATIESAVEAIKNGAYDYLPKPFDLEYLRKKVKQCFKSKRLSEQIESLKEVIGLYELSQAMSSSIGLKELLDLILDLACRALGADCGSIMLLDEKTGVLQVKVCYNLDEKYIKETNVKLGERISGWVADKGKAILIIDGFKGHPYFQDIEPRREIKSSVVAPLKVKDNIIGVINLNTTVPNKIFSNKHLKLLEIFAVNAAIAIHDAQVYDKIIELDKMKTEFVSNASHELRTPLTVIQNSLELLIPACSETAGAREKTLLELSHRNAVRMGSLIEELLDFSRLESGTLSITKTDINIAQIAEQAVEEMRRIADEKSISIESNLNKESIPLIRADALRMHQVFVNIINNAVKFTPKNGRIRLSVYCEGKQVVVKVEDNGIGIDDFHKNLIFDRFYQVDGSVSRAYGGLGLGLSIVQAIIEKHGGIIEVESEKGKGSIFYIKLNAE